jgi:CheY-like chemotaxis protein
MPHILIVEDDLATRTSLAMTFRAEGYATVEAADGVEALARLAAAAPPCLVLLDLMMPVMTGWEFLAERHKEPGRDGVPVVVLTAAAGIDGGALRAMGANDVLRKPADAADLLDVARRYCGPGRAAPG